MSAELASAYEVEKALGLPNEEDEEFFERLYPRLEAWFQWFNTSQTGLSSLRNYCSACICSISGSSCEKLRICVHIGSLNSHSFCL